MSRSLISKLSERGEIGCVIRILKRKVFESDILAEMVKVGAMVLKAVVPGIP